VPEAAPEASVVSVSLTIGHLPPIVAGQTHHEIPNHRARSLSELNLKRLASALLGQSNASMAATEHGDLSLECHQRVNDGLNDRCFSVVYIRMRAERPSVTITKKCHSISYGRFGHFDVNQVRGISLREAAVLRSFSEDYVFHPTVQIEPVARLIAIAVPPKLARYFASY
jgi:DNA (cytosine-5)-methyltransferase 1